MESVTMSQKNRKRKFLLVLPILVIPFMTMAFWALGAGKGNATAVTTQKNNQGLNLQLPSAKIKEDKDASKMSFYEKAKLDEEKNQKAMKNDPYYKISETDLDSNQLDEVVESSPTKYKPGETYSGLNNSPIHPGGYSDPNETKVMNKLSMLQKGINKPQRQVTEMDDKQDNYYGGGENLNGDIDKLKEMMHLMKEKQVNDPEMQKLEGMLDKIMDIQHPERVKERIKEKSIQQKVKAFPVNRLSTDQSISLLGKTDFKDVKGNDNNNGFYDLSDNKAESDQNSVEAVIHETQTLVNGSIVKLRLLNDVYINGVLILKGNFFFGVASLDGERLKIEINSICYEQSLFPVKLQVYDLDGLEGIYIPGTITRDVVKQSFDNGLQNIELTTLNSSLAAQATATGINAAKSLLGKKTKLIKVTVKSGYKVLLFDK